jgi:hypothetical protein
MASSVLANRVRVATATAGTGTVTLGAKVSNKYATFAEGGIANAQVVTYCIEDGNDWEIGRGTYTSAGTTLSRDTVLISSVGGTVGTSKLNLSGVAEVFIAAAKEDLDVNDFTEDTSPDATADFHWMYDASASLKKKVKPTNIAKGSLGTYTALSGATTTLTGISASAKMVVLNIVGMSWDATAAIRFRIGPSGGVATSGYLGAAERVDNGATPAGVNGTAGFDGSSVLATNVYHGSLIFTLADASSNTWAMSGVLGHSNTGSIHIFGGTVPLSGVLERIAITTVAATSSADAGSVSMLVYT